MLETLIFFQSKPNRYTYRLCMITHIRVYAGSADTHPGGGSITTDRRGTTGTLTTTTLIYTIGAGITAAAGTSLALQSILIKGFAFYSFQLQDMDALYCYFLSLPLCVRIG